jgi:uncharacterized protein YcbX
MPAFLDRITIFPIKSLDGVSVDKIDVLPGGGLANDRRFALLDGDGRFVIGKRTAAVYRIRAVYELPELQVQLRDTTRDAVAQFTFTESKREIGEWLSTALRIPCTFAENTAGGFPDDTAAPGPTLISTATLQAITTWFPELSLDEVRHRFRANLEIGGVEPFWEDRLVGPAGGEIPFQIGDFRWLGINPCQRCVVPSRAADTGEVTPAFQTVFVHNRQQSLPPWAPADRFDHFSRLAVNTRLDSSRSAGTLRRGDCVTLL